MKLIKFSGGRQIKEKKTYYIDFRKHYIIALKSIGILVTLPANISTSLRF